MNAINHANFRENRRRIPSVFNLKSIRASNFGRIRHQNFKLICGVVIVIIGMRISCGERDREKEREGELSISTTAVPFKQMLSIRKTSKHNRINSVVNFVNFSVYGLRKLMFPLRNQIMLTELRKTHRCALRARLHITLSLLLVSDTRYYFPFFGICVAKVALLLCMYISIFNSRAKKKRIRRLDR